MKKILLLTTGLSLFIAASAQAQELAGGKIGLKYSTFTGDADEVNKLSLYGGAELALSRTFSLQGDLAYNDFSFTDAQGNAVTLHAIAHLSSGASIGAYAGRESIEGEGESYFGVEFGTGYGAFGAEGYLTSADSEVLWGLQADYALSDMAKIGAGFDTVNIYGYDFTRFGVSGEFMVTEQVALNAEIGSLRIEDLGSETYISLGAELRFGNARGTTFGERHLTRFIPGL